MYDLIKQFISTISYDKGVNIDDGTDLFETAILDSMSIISLLTLLQEKTGLTFSPDDLQVENFKSIDSIMAWIERKKNDN